MTLMDEALAQVDLVSIIKHELPISFVLSYIGLAPTQAGDRVRCSCPFHQDDNPSFDVWREPDGTERWGCWPCGTRGDVIDLVRHFWPASFGATLQNCMDLRDACKQSHWKGPQPEPPRHEWDENAMLTVLWQAQRDFDYEAVDQLVLKKNWSFTAVTLRNLQCGTANGRLLIPYFDSEMRLVAMKHRSLLGDDKPISMPGSHLRDVLYLENRGRYHCPVTVIVEGESDAVTAYQACFFLDVEVLGLPSGAGTPVQPFLSRLIGRRVFLAFDGDEAGWAGEQRWLRAINESGGCAYSLGIPNGEDVVSLGPSTFGKMVKNAIEGAAQ